MYERIQDRLKSLTTEYEAGQKMLAELEAKQANLRSTLLRIGGAIQVLEELLSEDAVENDKTGEVNNTSTSNEVKEDGSLADDVLHSQETH